MRLGERVLLALSKKPGTSDYKAAEAEVNPDLALNLLHRAYPNFSELVSGKRVVDFGCGIGNQSIALARRYGCTVVGIDSNPQTLQKAIQSASDAGLPPEQVSFVDGISDDMLGSFDVVISQNSFEHFDEPERVVGEMRSLLKNSGSLLVTFGPPWYAPYGSHMHFFCRLPWVNLLFCEKTVMAVRAHFRSDGARRYEEVESGLNKMTLRRFESIVRQCQLKMDFGRYDCVKGVNWLAKLPLFRELFVVQVSAKLVPAG